MIEPLRDKGRLEHILSAIARVEEFTSEISSEKRDRKFLEQLWALPLDDSKTAEQKIKEVEESRKKGIIRDMTYVK